jgi:hypothetical protein
MARSRSPALVFSFDGVLLRIICECLCKGDTCDLALDDNFVNAHLRVRQFVYLHCFAGKKHPKELVLKVMARIFEIQLKDVRHGLEKGDPIPKGRREHPVPGEETDKPRLEWMTQRTQTHTPMNRLEPFYYCRDTLGAAGTEG